MSHADYQRIVERYVEAFDKADIAIIRDLFAADATVEDPVGSGVKKGIEEIVAFYQQGFASGARLKLSQPVRVAGNSVAFAFDVVLDGMTISPIDVFDINADGRIQAMRAYWGAENLVSG
ncbi:MAG TPA: nuclear transport factor 2 family protein [Pseudomonadales bacterium]